MKRSRLDKADFRKVADSLGVQIEEVDKAVRSFFDNIVKYAMSLPFDDDTRIYTRKSFENFAVINNIPYIGRIGPSYTRYLQWRRNESLCNSTVWKGKSTKVMDRDEIERIAYEILRNNNKSAFCRKVPDMKGRRVWIVTDNGKRLAKQIISDGR